MDHSKIQQIWNSSYADYCNSGTFQSDIQKRASRAIMDCKTGKLGCSIRLCTECGHIETHNNSCRNQNCPNCQAVNKEIWVDKRRSEVIDLPDLLKSMGKHMHEVAADEFLVIKGDLPHGIAGIPAACRKSHLRF